MKVKYFNVLTENEAQKTQIADHVQQSLDTKVYTKALETERDKLRAETEKLKRETVTKLRSVQEKTGTVSDLQQRLDAALAQAQQAAKQEKDIVQLKQNAQNYLAMLC